MTNPAADQPAAEKATLLEAAWAAGLFEGEGYVGIYHNPPKAEHKSRRHGMKCGVSNSDLALLRPLKNRWGGGITVLSAGRSKFKSNRPCYQWTVHAQKAARFLRDIQPYLRGVRAEKTAIALEFQDRLSVSARPRNSRSQIKLLSEEELQCRENLKMRLRSISIS